MTLAHPPAKPGRDTNRRRRVGARWRLTVAAALFASAALPAVGGPSAAGGAESGCWRAGTAPGLFDWSATPGIACRDGTAAAFAGAPVQAATEAPAGNAPAGRSGTPAQLSFSGSAYVGIAVLY